MGSTKTPHVGTLKMQPHHFVALKRSASSLCGQRVALASSFAARLDELAPGLGQRLIGGPAEDLISTWVEAARCAQRWQNVAPMLKRAVAEMRDVGMRSREFEMMQHAWMATLQDALGDRLDDELREAWRELLGQFILCLREANDSPIGVCATLA